ncbi:type II CRISPR RNA-guided endonuclease Cas9 [Helicobacter sp. MIT 14-3879]|uniref:type II CRISPR RNA-guided endonuclease Cas9 n=1 Tax=Helicobacter sp. MIT 14-3879 TaxID=2040649 RepID=UPI000E1F0E3B|nr:type II CRISPR RNA-guided endonuclease Cas9 [Helicobacter sp. MIT 14-3879]RDU64855.1 type II CRISPR RNA-guided endonuclease Cas9 [Helicobacter sp. MIT 14-3879]
MKILGFDIGIASVGWAYVEENELRDCGVRIFTKAENSTGESLALPRREARGTRRRLKRRKQRLNELKRLLCKQFNFNLNDYCSNDGELAKAYQTTKDTKSPYELRALALEQKLDSKDLVRVILHIAKHRGYGNKHAKRDLEAEEKIKAKIEKEDQEITQKATQEKQSTTTKGDSKKEQEQVLKALYRNETALKHYQTVGQYFYKEFKEKGQRIRNTTNNYQHTMRQDWLKKELELIFEKQKEFGAKFSEGFENKIIEIAFFQRDLKSFEDKVGQCTFYPNEPRAPKDSLSAIEFVTLTRIINTLKNLEEKSKNLGIGEVYGKDKIKEILNIVLDKGEISYKKLREILGLNEQITFKDNKLDYAKDMKEEQKVKLIEFKNLKDFKKAIGGSFQAFGSFETFDRKELDLIATDIAVIKSRENLAKKLENYPSLTQEQRESLSELNFSKHINLSLRALEKILPFMREGLRYNEAVEKAGLQEHRKHKQKSDFLPPLQDYEPYLANPVVERALSEYRKVLNALLRKYGQVHKIHLEFTREAKLSSKERQKYEKEQRENFARNQEAEKQCEAIGLPLNDAKNILKMKLWIEQRQLCAYSGEKITIEHLKDSTMLEIDHIYPYSRSYDDSYNNKVLCLARENQNKGNHTPFEAFGKDTEKWDRILSLASKLPKPKYRRISNKQFKDKEAGFLARNIVDTSYIARLASEYTKHSLNFLPLSEDEVMITGEKDSKKHVEVVSGSLTATLRHYWGLGGKNGDKDRDNHLHHVVDAIIIAYTNAKVIKAFSDFRKLQEQNRAKFYAKEIAQSKDKTKKGFEPPCENFRNKIQEKVDSIFVSKPPRKRARGALHEETFYSLNDASLLKSYGGQEGVQRALELGKIRRIGTKVVSNGEMKRVDIFKDKKGKFYGVPIYTMDFALGILPNKAVISGKKDGVIKDWLEMDSNYEFCFSLFKDDLILVQKSEMEEPELCYYVGFDSCSPRIIVDKHNKCYKNMSDNEKKLFTLKERERNNKKEEQKQDDENKEQKIIGGRLGIQNLKTFKKYQVSPLGEVKEVGKETRQAIALKSTKHIKQD